MFSSSPPPSTPLTSGPQAQSIALGELDPATQGSAAAPSLVTSLHPIHQVKATLQVCVGTATVTVGELMAAKEHQVLQLDRDIQHPVDLVLEGQVIARGQLVAVDGRFAVRLTELPAPLSLGAPAQP